MTGDPPPPPPPFILDILRGPDNDNQGLVKFSLCGILKGVFNFRYEFFKFSVTLAPSIWKA